MSPRLEAIARYHRGYRKAMSRVAFAQQAGCAQSNIDRLLERAAAVYFAMANEKSPDLAKERGEEHKQYP